MLDDDVVKLPPGWGRRMAHIMETHPNCYMCSPRLLRPHGGFGHMTGEPTNGFIGCEVLRRRELCTAMIAIRNTGIMFDENYIGSGFEDNDYCRQLVRQFPNAEFICIHDLQVTHLNEQKNQSGRYWQTNKAYFMQKWGRTI